MNFSIRLAKSDEIEILIDLQSLSLSRLQSGKYNKRQMNAIIQSQKTIRVNHNFHEIVFVAEADDATIVGFSIFLVNLSQIGGVFVHPKFAGQGIGTELVKEIEQAAFDKKMRNLYVMSSLEAVGFYQKIGYSLLRKDGFFAKGVWIPCKLLKKQLIPLTKIERFCRKIVEIATWLGLVLLFISIFI